MSPIILSSKEITPDKKKVTLDIPEQANYRPDIKEGTRILRNLVNEIKQIRGLNPERFLPDREDMTDIEEDTKNDSKYPTLGYKEDFDYLEEYTDITNSITQLVQELLPSYWAEISPDDQSLFWEDINNCLIFFDSTEESQLRKNSGASIPRITPDSIKRTLRRKSKKEVKDLRTLRAVKARSRKNWGPTLKKSKKKTDYELLDQAVSSHKDNISIGNEPLL